MKAIAWNMAERGRSLQAGVRCAVVYHPAINEWNNHREVQLEVKDFALAGDDRLGPSPGSRAAVSESVATI
jgi:hypothetical protein